MKYPKTKESKTRMLCWYQPEKDGERRCTKKQPTTILMTMNSSKKADEKNKNSMNN